MYPGRSIWAALALGAGILLLSGLQWWSESIRDDDPSIFERSSRKDVDIFVRGSGQLEDDRRSKRSDRDTPRNAEIEKEGGIFTAFSVPIVGAEASIVKRMRRDKIEEDSRFSPEGSASILESSEGDERRFAGMREEQLPSFRENRLKRAESAFREGNLGESENNDEEKDETDLTIDEEGRSRDAPSEDLNGNLDSEFRDDESDGDDKEESTSGFRILDSDIKRGKVTRGEESKDLMVANNFALTSQARRVDPGGLVSKFRPIVASRKKRKTRRTIRPTIVLRRTEDRRVRHANHYSAQSATPMAYVHIQPAFPAAPPPTSRKCVRCMVVYKPCPSKPRSPPRIVLPNYKYRKPASNWRGLKYGE